MRSRWTLLAFLCALALLPSVLGQAGANWQSVPVRFSWDLSMSHFCANTSQCLLHLQGSPAFDGDVQRWFLYSHASNWPKCINNTQHVLDYRCENGNWTTRTKHLALWLLQLADTTSPTNFTLFCDSYRRVLNQYRYLVQGVLVESYLGQFCSVSGKIVPCVNSLCVLKTPAAVAVGATLNVPVNDPSKSFLKALDKPVTLCNSVSATSPGFSLCGENVWYHPGLLSVVYLPTGSLSSPGSTIETKLTSPLGSMSSYVMSVLHDAANPGMNFAYFPKTRLFNHLYVAQHQTRAVFGFLEEGLRPEYDPVPLDYIGVRYTGISLGANPCLNIIKVTDSRAFCENQTGTGFNVIARHRPTQLGASPIVGLWPALTGKLRP